MQRAGYQILALLGSLALHTQAFAQRGLVATTPKRQYTAPAECPAAPQFWQEVQERSAGSEAPAADVVVTIERREGHYAAQMLLGAAETQSERSVVGERCDETSTAMALVVALALAAQRHEQRSAERGPVMHLSLEGEGVVDGAPAPQLAFGAGAGVRVATRDRKAEIGFVLGYRGIEARALGQGFGVRLFSLRVDACPIGLELGWRLDLMPCGFADVGALRAEAESGFSSKAGPVYAAWGSLGALVRLNWRVAGPLTLALAPGVQAPLQRGYQLSTRAPQSERSIPLHIVPDWSFFGGVAARYDLD
jgi:hypothetical protein